VTTAFKITVAYDGTGYVGWQRQASGVSIQGLLEDAVGELEGRDVPVAGAGRTDAGVHALGQVASFNLEREMAPAVLLRAVNARLPPAVRVIAAQHASADFHARFGARSKTYRYWLWNGDTGNPFERQYSWHVAAPLDVDRMAQAARLVEGRHDFAAFQTAGSDAQTTEREVFSSRITSKLSTTVGGGDLIQYEITGDGFLRHMVRAIVGTLVEIGRGSRPVTFMQEVIESRNRAMAGPTAPAEGLFLVSVAYDGEPFDIAEGHALRRRSGQACG
jgi:tRNA pseudouridine38-40 synthase